MSDEQPKSNRLLLWLSAAGGVILLLAIVFRDLVLAILAGSARGVSNEAKKEDADLKEQQKEVERQAKSEEEKAKEAADRVANRKVDDIDEDWHKRS